MTIDIEFEGEMWFWQGPAPWFFVTVPAEGCQEIREISGSVSYGWGVIPASVTIGKTVYSTSLFPKEGRYIVPIKSAVRKAEGLEEGDVVSVRLEI